jgi:hypothetical protein
MSEELAQSFSRIVTFHPVAGGDHVSVIGKAANQILAAMSQ